MFDSLKKKLSNFLGHFSAPSKEPEAPAPVEAQAPEPVKPIESPVELPVSVEIKPVPEAEPEADSVPTPVVSPEPAKVIHHEHPALKVERTVHQESTRHDEKPVSPVHHHGQPVHSIPSPVPASLPAPSTPSRELAPKLGLLARMKSIISPQVTLGEAELSPVFSELELALLESDVSPDTAEFLLADLRKRLVGAQVSRSGMSDAVKEQVRQSLALLFSTPPFDLSSYVAAHKAKNELPVVILFVGPNGAGKTTTLAKLAKQLSANGFSSIIAAGDTFRKAAIEQAQIHGEKLNVRVVKHAYGADPTAVAFDAIAAAKAGGIDVVLVDTAGRQETNVNLVREMEKMQRVLKPQLKIFVGEAIAGHSLVDQVRTFHKAIVLDGIILTKLDCDAKGGIAFSLGHEVPVPILFVGTGQEYDDLVAFDPAWLTENVLAA